MGQGSGADLGQTTITYWGTTGSEEAGRDTGRCSLPRSLQVDAVQGGISLFAAAGLG